MNHICNSFVLQFTGCLILIILLELSVGIAAAAMRPNVEGTMKTHLRASFIKNKSTKEEDSTYREFWDRIQNNVSIYLLNHQQASIFLSTTVDLSTDDSCSSNIFTF